MPINGHTKSHHILTVFFSLAGTRKYHELLQGICSQSALKASTHFASDQFQSMTKGRPHCRLQPSLLHRTAAACCPLCLPWPLQLCSVPAQALSPAAADLGRVCKVPPESSVSGGSVAQLLAGTGLCQGQLAAGENIRP